MGWVSERREVFTPAVPRCAPGDRIRVVFGHPLLQFSVSGCLIAERICEGEEERGHIRGYA